MVIVDTSAWIEFFRRDGAPAVKLAMKVLVATLALRQGCRVYAVDQHFEAMARHLDLQLYKPGYNGGLQREAESK